MEKMTWVNGYPTEETVCCSQFRLSQYPYGNRMSTYDKSRIYILGKFQSVIHIALFYPKGQRPQLPYPQNKKEYDRV